MSDAGCPLFDGQCTDNRLDLSTLLSLDKVIALAARFGGKKILCFPYSPSFANLVRVAFFW
jgi:hypothetical protein